jgi:hypothetical protein
MNRQSTPEEKREEREEERKEMSTMLSKRATEGKERERNYPSEIGFWSPPLKAPILTKAVLLSNHSPLLW